jgi:hypothetical protein
MISFAKPELIQEFRRKQKEYFAVTYYMLFTYTWHIPSLLIRVKSMISSQGTLHKDYGCKDSVAKINSGCELQGAWRQAELICGKRPVVK